MTRSASRFAVWTIALAGLLALPGSTRAGTLTSASWSQVVYGFPMSRSAGQLGPITGSSTGASISASLSYPQTTIAFFLPKTLNGSVDRAITITQGGAQAITATATMANATIGVPGSVVVMTAIHAAMAVNQSMYDVGAVRLAAIPLSFGGVGHLEYTTPFGIGNVHDVTVDFYGWTVGTRSFTNLTSGYLPIPNVTAMGSFALTPNGGGTVTLVAPNKISIDGPIAQRRTVALATLTLTFVPEPGSLLLIGAAAIALGLAARRA